MKISIQTTLKNNQVIVFEDKKFKKLEDVFKTVNSKGFLPAGKRGYININHIIKIHAVKPIKYD